MTPIHPVTLRQPSPLAPSPFSLETKQCLARPCLPRATLYSLFLHVAPPPLIHPLSLSLSPFLSPAYTPFFRFPRATLSYSRSSRTATRRRATQFGCRPIRLRWPDKEPPEQRGFCRSRKFSPGDLNFFPAVEGRDERARTLSPENAEEIFGDPLGRLAKSKTRGNRSHNAKARGRKADDR